MKFKNNSTFLQLRHHLDVSIVMKLSRLKHGALVIATTARCVFGVSM